MKKNVLIIVLILFVFMLLFKFYTPFTQKKMTEITKDYGTSENNKYYDEFCPVQDIKNFSSCAEYCLEHIGWNMCKEWCTENYEKCNVTVSEPPKEEPQYWKIYSVDFWDKDYISDIRKVSEMNGNMIMIFFSAAPLPDGSLDVYRYEPKKTMELIFAKGISTAHENGLHVIFDLEIGGPEAIPSENRKIFLENFKNFVSEWAEFCEKQGVYAFNINSELDNEFFVPTNCVEECKNREVSKLAQELLREVKKHYTGKIGVGILDTCSSDYNLTGYDFFTTNLPCGDGNVQGCLDFYGEAISGAAKLKKKYNVSKFVIGEVDIFSENDATPEGRDAVRGFKIVSEEEETNFYNEFFERYANQVDGVTITYSYPLGIKTGPAKNIVRRWFGKIN